MSYPVKNGQTSVVLRFKLLDSSSTTGAGLTGLTSASGSLIISTIADNEATATAYTQAGSTIETITTLGTYAAPTATKCRFKEVDSTNHKGVYEFQFADARFAVASAKSLLISVAGATNLAQADYVLALTSDDPYVAKPTNSSLLSIDGSGVAKSNLVQVNAHAVTDTTNGVPDVNAKNIANVAAALDANNLLKVDVEDINGNATAAANVSKANQAIMRGTCSGGTTATAICSAITSPASLTDSGQLIGRTILFDSTTTTTNVQGQASNITASTTGATPTITFTAMTHAPANGDTFSVV